MRLTLTIAERCTRTKSRGFSPLGEARHRLAQLVLPVREVHFDRIAVGLDPDDVFDVNENDVLVDAYRDALQKIATLAQLAERAQHLRIRPVRRRPPRRGDP